VALTPQNSIQAVADVLYSGVLERHPNLKIALSEGGIGWLPYFLERVDYVYQQHHTWLNQDFGDMLPSQIIKRNFTFCFIDDKHGIDAREKIGIENITWECDYPHSDSTWPQSPETVEKHFAEIDISDEDINKITYENALRVFNFDPFKHIPKEEATVGALREKGKDVDLTLKSSERHQGEHSKSIGDFSNIGKDINKPNKG
ncbi:MAG: amidohydrolase family protein, partial [Halobacteriales archaeon]|nr:amidohydrolase family protein [Halobacteriales archaeon]